MLRWSLAILFAGALCVPVTSVSAAVTSADVAADAMSHVNAALLVPGVQASPDPCAGRKWSPSHPFTFCGRVRIVPADATERDLWWGQRLSELADAYFSAAGQHTLFASRQVVVNGMVPSFDGRRASAFELRGQSWTIAGVQGFASPAAAEANPLVRPFAAGGIGGYLLGFAAMDIGQSTLMELPGTVGLRGLDELSRRSLLGQDIGEHVDGAQSWLPILREARSVNAITASCADLAARSWTYDASSGAVSIAPAPKQCTSIWPTP